MRHLSRLAVALAALLAATAARGGKQEFQTWPVDVVFVNGSSAATDDEVRAVVETWVANAERLYQRRPALDVTYTIVKEATRGGRRLDRLVFEGLGAYARWMDEHFDTIATTRTSGRMQVVITDQLCIGTEKGPGGERVPKCWGGYAHFPHNVNPAGKKRGIAMKVSASPYAYAHELGHVFGIKHTFEPYVGLNLQCNDAYRPKGEAGHCNSCSAGGIVYVDGLPERCPGPVNLMDYCSSTDGDEHLNPCQEERAARQRRRYMTAKGETDYHALKGVAGAEVCREDEDCGASAFCQEGPIHNECKPLLADGKACTRDGQCGTGKCSGWRPQDGQASGICYAPASRAGGESCRVDPECRSGKCNSAKTCVCKADGDCAAGLWCDAGLDASANACKPKLDEGAACGVGLGLGHRCKSGKCRLGKCT